MSGHSKWSTIKRKKEATDAKKGQLFSKLSKLIEIAAKKGADPKTNFSLKAIVDKAKASNMPVINIEKAIKKGAGLIAGEDSLEEILYEAYGPSGAAILILAITSNRNRTVSEIKHILSNNGGRLAEIGSVKWLFEEKGILRMPCEGISFPELEEFSILNNAEDITLEDGSIEIVVAVSDLENFKNIISQKNINNIDSGIEWVAKNNIDIPKESEGKLSFLLEELDNNEDISEVFTNAN
ncbi:MAG: YebC/PmpR family DNA-binding transcriptional regulator [bacterium]|nr:YebC/PmpR family DNA-binding transcriptional regulator [bacterium]